MPGSPPGDGKVAVTIIPGPQSWTTGWAPRLHLPGLLIMRLYDGDTNPPHTCHTHVYLQGHREMCNHLEPAPGVLAGLVGCEVTGLPVRCICFSSTTPVGSRDRGRSVPGAESLPVTGRLLSCHGQWLRARACPFHAAVSFPRVPRCGSNPGSAVLGAAGKWRAEPSGPSGGSLRVLDAGSCPDAGTALTAACQD